jgi:uncharacterized protein (TIGR00369 family)
MIALMPFAASLRIRLVDASPQRVVAEMTVRDDLCTAGAILHGGAIMAFADSVAAVGAMLNLPEGASTTTLADRLEPRA